MRERQIQASTDALNTWDFDALADVFHPELEHRSTFAALQGEVYHGIDGQRRRWENVHATWAEFRISVSAVHHVDDDRTVVVLRLQGRARASGVPLDDSLAQLWTWRDGKVWRIATYPVAEAALAAARGAGVDET